MMADKMNCTNDEDMIRMAFRVLDKDGSGTISSKTFKHLMTHIGKYKSISFQHYGCLLLTFFQSCFILKLFRSIF